MHINRRSDLRVPVRCEVQLQMLTKAALSHRCLSQDISVGGMQILSDQPYPLNSKVLLAFDCKELGWGQMSCAASVMWVDPHPTNGRCRLGIKFRDTDGR